MDSGALRKVIRAEMAVGVKPWSASATSTASKTRACCGVGSSRVISWKARCPKLTCPMRSADRSRPSSEIVCRSETPSDVG